MLSLFTCSCNSNQKVATHTHADLSVTNQLTLVNSTWTANATAGGKAGAAGGKEKLWHGADRRARLQLRHEAPEPRGLRARALIPPSPQSHAHQPLVHKRTRAFPRGVRCNPFSLSQLLCLLLRGIHGLRMMVK